MYFIIYKRKILGKQKVEFYLISTITGRSHIIYTHIILFKKKKKKLYNINYITCDSIILRAACILTNGKDRDYINFYHCNTDIMKY